MEDSAPIETEWQKELDIASLLHSYATGSTDVLTVIKRCLNRIEKEDGKYRSVLHINPHALEEAQKIDAEFNSIGRLQGPLHGIPVLIKANIRTKDAMPTSCGSVILANYMADEDAAVVQKLRAQGAVILGKTNLSEFCNYVSIETNSGYSSLGGQTHSIFGPDHAVGGSSSGSAVAAAANFCSFSIGTETDGSVVYPAAHNGVFAFKSAKTDDINEGIIGISKHYDQVGILSSSLKNLEYAVQCLIQPLPSSRPTLAWLETASFGQEASSENRISRLSTTLTRAGIALQSCDIAQAIEPQFPAFDIVCKTEFKHDMVSTLPLPFGEFLSQSRSGLLHKFHPDIGEIERSLASEHAEDGSYAAALSQLLDFRKDWENRLQKAGNPILIAQTTGPSEIASIATLLGLSHIVVPWHDPESCLPIGISVMAQTDSLIDVVRIINSLN